MPNNKIHQSRLAAVTSDIGNYDSPIPRFHNATQLSPLITNRDHHILFITSTTARSKEGSQIQNGSIEN